MIPKTIAFRYDDEAKALVIDYPDIPLIGPYRIKDDTLASMSFAQAAAFCLCIQYTWKFLKTIFGPTREPFLR